MSEESLQLLPPANLSSPTNKSFELKTPPHSTLRTSNIKRIEDSNNSILHSEKHGLLSPEFSSPQLRYDSDIVGRNKNNNTQNDTNNNKISSSSSSCSNNNNNNNGINSNTNLNDSPTHDSSSDKENNLNSTIRLPLPAPDFSNKKRSFPSSNIDITAKRSRKFKGPVDCVIPEPHEMPLIVFESNLKPPYSYASLIGMALLRSPERRLTLAEIYQWISDNFKYYKKGEVGWQNSIRHNLSLNKSFEKAEKSKDRKGHFWQIVSGYEYIFCNIKESKRNINSANSVKKSKSSKSQNQNESNESNESLLLSTPVSNKSHDEYDDDSSYNYDINSVKSNNYSYNNDDDKFDSISKKIDFKNQTPINTTTLGSIPELNIQYSSYGTNLGSLNSSPMIFYHDSPIDNSINSKNIDFTSSFSCKSNFELSPIRMNETGPLLEPITPNINNSLLKVSLPPIQKQLQSLQQFPTSLSTPTSTSKLQQSQQQQQLLQQQHQQHLQIPISSDIHASKFRTPSRIMNSPLVNACSSSIMKKLWTSPSYLDDFYTSPIALNRDNANNLNSVIYPNGNGIDNVTDLFGNRTLGSPLPPLKKKILLKNTANNNLTNGYSTNEIFGIDICTINLQDDDHYK